MIKVEFHCHTRYSKDSLVKPGDLIKTCHRKGIQRLVVTDHNSIGGALEAVAMDQDLFIAGEEIMTNQGELLAIFIKELIPAGLSAIETIAHLRSQDAFIAVSHPFDSFRKGHWELDDLQTITPLVDAIEVYNSRCIDPSANQKAAEYAARHNLAGIVGSDAHSLAEVGTSTLILPDFADRPSLLEALSKASAEVRLSSPFVHFYSRYAAWRKRIKPVKL